MKKFIQGNNWLIGLLIVSMPILLIYALGSQMAYGQVQRRYAIYAGIPEYTSLANLKTVAAGETVLLRGQVAEPATASSTVAETNSPLLIYQERPLDGREVRFREEFPLVFPELALVLQDGPIVVQPGDVDERTISHEFHRVTIDDREFTGFQVGDTITLQGKWQPATDAQSMPTVVDITGISGVEKAVLLAEVQAALQQVSRVRNGLGLLTLVSIVLLVSQLIYKRKSQQFTQGDDPASGIIGGITDELTGEPVDELGVEQEEKQVWHPPTTKTVPTI